MPKEQLVFGEQEDFKKNLSESIAKAIHEFLEKDSDATVSQAQMEAFERMVNSLPDGKFKEFVNRFEGPQKTSSKLNELIYDAQDGAWKMIKPFITLGAPVVAAIPKDPFRKLAIKSSRLGGFLGEKVIKTTVEQSENIKNKVRNFKNRKKLDGV
ncbi:MAG TPA: hypothetical protein VMR19_01735 [Candidatus Saccharimonadales bacterium]|jgi:MFS superfamily sulfate permease-like transporter|nr:hypothetical protein [Candidatus Saccharimonadales bacterium]